MTTIEPVAVLVDVLDDIEKLQFALIVPVIDTARATAIRFSAVFKFIRHHAEKNVKDKTEGRTTEEERKE